MADAGTGLQDVGRALKTQTLQTLVNTLDDRLRGVMGILSRTAGLAIFFDGQKITQFGGFGFPLFIFEIEGLRQAAPADIAHQGLLINR